MVKSRKVRRNRKDPKSCKGCGSKRYSCKCRPRTRGGKKLRSYKRNRKSRTIKSRTKNRFRQRGGFRLLADNMRPWSVFDGTANAIGNGIAEVQGKMPSINPSVVTQHI
tara:strand:+ start:2589 stop:2915 length:327 start_codon:yes stop_codon:yes gene_type:complete